MNQSESIDPWLILDATTWHEEQPEDRGKRAKVWLRASDGRRFLFKQPLARRRTEAASELLSQRIARAAGLRAAETWPGIRAIGEHQQQGLLSLDFTERDSSLTAGAALMAKMDSTYNAEIDLGEHTLLRVRTALRALPGGGDLALEFAKMVLLDAWLGNGDRHPGNWSIIEMGSIALAPIYDTASPFGPELDDNHALVTHGHDYDVRLSRYIARCSSGFGRGGRKTVPQDQVIADLRRWEEYGEAKEVVKRFAELLQEDLPAYVGAIPEEWLPRARGRLTIDVLARRLEWLEERL